MSDAAPPPAEAPARRWQPLSAIDRRVVGVLVEKAKTTPDGYPMSVNALRSGANQKNNRYPLMELETEDIEESLARLRAVGAAAEVQGGGRVPRYRHYMYEWLGVDKVELAVMAELLLRGAQTEGELRGRAARMEPIADLAALRPVLGSLRDKGLVVSLSPEGRGHVLTHALYEPRELEKLRAEHASGAAAQPHADASHGHTEPAETRLGTAAARAHHDVHADHREAGEQDAHQLRRELDELRNELAGLRADFERLKAELL